MFPAAVAQIRLVLFTISTLQAPGLQSTIVFYLIKQKFEADKFK